MKLTPRHQGHTVKRKGQPDSERVTIRRIEKGNPKRVHAIDANGLDVYFFTNESDSDFVVLKTRP